MPEDAKAQVDTLRMALGVDALMRMRLTADDIARVRIASAPDFGDELVIGGYVLANGIQARRLARWRQEVARRWNPDMAVLFDFYTSATLPGFLKPAVARDASAPAVDPDFPTMVEYVHDLARKRSLTPFTRALADGRQPACEQLNRAVAGFQSAAIDPYRSQISSQVAAAAGRAAARATTSGIGALLQTLHPAVHWNGTVLSIDTVGDAEVELCARALVLRPSALAVKPGLSGDAESVVLSFPTGGSVLGFPTGSASPALSALLGATRAAALLAIVHTPALTTGQLAAALNVSPSVASRHASILRAAGLTVAVRDGMAVRHHPTQLGAELAANSW